VTRRPIPAPAKAEYVRCNGLRCPHCGSKDTGRRFAYGESGILLYDVECPDCSANWTETYRLIGVDGSEDD